MLETLTTHLRLPLPHPEHMLNEDVIRIRDAFTALDQKIAALDTLLTSDDLSLDTIQELIGAIKAARTEIGAVRTLIASQLTAQNTAIASQLATQNTAINTSLTAQNTTIASQLATQNTTINTRLTAQDTAVASQLATLSALVYAGL